MLNFKKSNLLSLLKGLDTAQPFKGLQTLKLEGLKLDAGKPTVPGGSSHRLQETQSFGSNPGQLRMFSHRPGRSSRPSALVVVLHGCGQTAAGYDDGAGWSTLADRYGFAVLFPEQQRSNNPNGCFNWFQPEDTQRGRGEAASIHQMVDTMVRDSGIDPQRVYVTGLSAGGAMTSVMLACYPETFAAGAIIAGLPYGSAANVQQALKSMYQSPPRAAKQWGDLVRAAAPKDVGAWPRISVWHGGADKTVIRANARETIKQWTDVHGLTEAPSKEDNVQGYPRQVWLNARGEDVIESYTIPHMAHGTPLATGDADDECGVAGPFLLDVGISSSFHIAKFFGLTPDVAMPAAAKPEQMHAARATYAGTAGKSGAGMDIGAVISAALAKAGLLNRS